MLYNEIFIAHIEEIQHCLENRCYLAALSLSLVLPDICGKAEFPNQKSGERYKKWYKNYMIPFEKPVDPISADMPYLSEEVVYQLRNAFLHTGNPDIEKDKIKDESCRIDNFKLFISNEPDGDMSSVSYGVSMEIRHRTYTVAVRDFCLRMAKKAKEYYFANSEKFNFFTYEFEDDKDEYKNL